MSPYYFYFVNAEEEEILGWVPDIETDNQEFR